MKKSKHITINVSELEYTQLLKLAEKDRRKLAEFVALVVLDATESARVETMRVNDGYIKKADIKTGFKILQNKN